MPEFVISLNIIFTIDLISKRLNHKPDTGTDSIILLIVGPVVYSILEPKETVILSKNQRH